MAWPIPSAKAIAERAASALETAIIRIRPSIDQDALSRAVRSARGMFAQILRVFSLELRTAHDHVAYWARQYFIDTAEEDMILRHSSMWGVPQRAATFAVGTILVEGEAGTALPVGLEISVSDGTRYLTTEEVTIGEDGTVSVSVEAAIAGAGGNMEAGIRVVTVEPWPEISKATIEAPGIAGGTDEERLTELQAAVLEHIRQRPHGGAGFDYPTWIKRNFAAKAVGVVPDWIGRGSVGVVVAMKDDGGEARAPSEEELAAMLTYLGAPGSATGVRPVTAHVVMVAAELTTIPVTVRLRPDTVATRAAVQEAYERYIATIGDAEDTGNASPIGAWIEPSRLSDELSAADGEYAHDLVVPAARYQLANKQYPVAGTVTFASAL